MDFLDKVGATISSKGRDVAKKAKDIAEVASLNGQICVQEEAIKKIFQEIGRLMYEQRGDWMSASLAEKCQEADAAYAEMDRLKKEILTIKGAKECPSCGVEITGPAVFCPSCGARMPEEEQAAEEAPAQEAEAAGEEPQPTQEEACSSCPGCGKAVDGAASFCPSCGAKLKNTEE